MVDPEKATQGISEQLYPPQEPRHAPPDRCLYLRTIRTSLQAAKATYLVRSQDRTRQHHPHKRGTQRNRVIVHDHERTPEYIEVLAVRHRMQYG